MAYKKKNSIFQLNVRLLRVNSVYIQYPNTIYHTHTHEERKGRLILKSLKNYKLPGIDSYLH